ncbi:MAG: hypothetical protein ACRDHF_12295 [Tepidiformaceae bacterium]
MNTHSTKNLLGALAHCLWCGRVGQQDHTELELCWGCLPTALREVQRRLEGEAPLQHPRVVHFRVRQID